MKRNHDTSRTAGDKLRALATKLNNGNKLNICSLLLVTGLAVTLAVMSQDMPKDKAATEAATAVVAPTLPAERAITDTKGRKLEGTIVSKTDTAISFTRKGTSGPIEIKLELLSPEDQAFIATLTAGAPAAPKKTSVLFVVAAENYNDYVDTLTWIKTNGFDVTVGHIYTPQTGLSVAALLESVRKRYPTQEKVIVLNPITLVDQYDMLWIYRPLPYSNGVKNEWEFPTIIGHAMGKKQLMVIRCYHKRQAKIKYYLPNYDPHTDKAGYSNGGENYIKRVENFVFYQDKDDPTSTEKTRSDLLVEINKARSGK